MSLLALTHLIKTREGKEAPLLSFSHVAKGQVHFRNAPPPLTAHYPYGYPTLSRVFLCVGHDQKSKPLVVVLNRHQTNQKHARLTKFKKKKRGTSSFVIITVNKTHLIWIKKKMLFQF